MLQTLYYLIIYPIELVIEICFYLINNISSNPGIAIIGVSIVINILLLPLYRRADSIQAEERDKQSEMKRWVEHIRSTFKGDEKVMLLSAYYRKKDYHPFYALRSSISLLLQIPFFIAAYHFLSNLSILNKASFLFIDNLGLPDGLISVGNVSINLLPILMTLINCISALVYTKGAPIKDNIQIYILAGLFLILLYPSPSGLVLYWTMNNIFSLVKNIVLKEPADTIKERKLPDNAERFGYWGGALLLTFLIGLLIPSALVTASPAEFVEPAAYRNPLSFVFSTFCIASGFFLCWMSVFYALMTDRAKRCMRLVIWIICCLTTIDYFIFARNPGTITADLAYVEFPEYTMKNILVQLAALAAAGIVIVIIWKRQRTLINIVYVTLTVAIVIMSCMNIRNISRSIADSGLEDSGVDSELTIPLSKNNKNVVVIMLDGAVSGFIPYIMEEKPELKESFSGFVYYPNTISFGMHTNFGAPALYGGYEYSPVAINSRPEQTLVEKNDEALSVLPVLFSSMGYETTVFDPPHAHYKHWPDLRIYEPYPEVHAYHARSHFVDPDYYAMIEKMRRRSFFMYSLVRVSPKALQALIYDDGEYLFPDELEYDSWNFVTAYAVLKNFISMSDIKETDNGTFMIIDNDVTHDERELQLPDYDLSITVNNGGLESGYRTDADGNILRIDETYLYHSDMAAILRISEWLDYLKENGVYDNTRIVIVSDHGWANGDFPELILDDGTDMEAANALLMFKDFNTEGFTTSDEFMTNADAPVLAVKNLTETPTNPFTDVILDDSEKHLHDQYVTASDYHSSRQPPNDAEARKFTTDDAPWYSVHDDIFDKSNWSVVPEPMP